MHPINSETVEFVKPIMSAAGLGGQLELFPGKIKIKRKGILGFSNHVITGDKEIYLSQISSIKFNGAGLISGQIQFAFLGGVEAKGGIFQANMDQNTVMFSPDQQKNFELIK